MASLKGFSKNMSRRAALVEQRMNEKVIRASIAVSQTVILSTPVDTGRARNNWFLSLDRPLLNPTEETDISGFARIDSNNTKVKSRKPGSGSVYITNNVHYIGLLNAGSSSQAPAGFVEKGVLVGLKAAGVGKVLE